MLNTINYQRNTNQNRNEDHLTAVRRPSKNLQTKSAGEVIEQRELSYTVSESTNGYSLYGKQYGASLKNLKKDPAIPLLGT